MADINPKQLKINNKNFNISDLNEHISYDDEMFDVACALKG
tara:strand:- start:9726 stop:9848 length:123 start_codon:yes stop_codon:yes gene_type:complete